MIHITLYITAIDFQGQRLPFAISDPSLQGVYLCKSNLRDIIERMFLKQLLIDLHPL